MPAAVCVAALTVACTSVISGSPQSVSGEAPQKLEFTAVTASMFVDRSAVPNSPATEFTPPSVESVSPEPNEPVDPPECGPLFWGPQATQAGSATWTTSTTSDTSAVEELRVFNLFLTVPTERPDLESLVGPCASVEFEEIVTTVEPLNVPGLPSGSLPTRIATEGADGASIIGLCRGLYVSVAFTQKPGGDLSSDDVDALAKLYTAQVAKLEAI
ncbi:hypothetical protein AB4Z42_10645 [Mycobacterium sp. 2YAF39]|uniref:hypothetical protein n=1 Tax=Mycobacterium sp. 2YAF39 TaxID=3233033 RepID=UPI003F97C7D3